MIEYPKLRPVEAIPAQDNLICLRDPLGYSDQLVFLPLEALFVVSLFDGRHSVLDVQAEFTRRFGTILLSEKVQEIIRKLDECLLLESERFQEARRRALEAFRSAAKRPASHAGGAYEAEPDALRRQLQELFEGSGGSTSPSSPAVSEGVLRGLIAPHIDLRRGGGCFARSYAELERGCRAETFVVLGIAHVPTCRRFALCAKDFETPLGVLPVDRDFLQSLDGRLQRDFYEDEFVHRSEHSVEFQAVFLQFLYGGLKPVRFVPILCSGFEKAAVSGLPEEEPEFREFVEALRLTLAESRSSACCIAAVDLSHLGRRFGQEVTLGRAFLEQAEADDRRMIERILAGDAEGFLRLIQEERDCRNVCGVPAIYTLLRLLEGQVSGRAGRLLSYEQAVEDSAQSVVTFMGAAFYS